MYPAGNLFIGAPHGRVEAILKEPSGEPRGAALVLHPHPLHGGTMHNKVVFRTARALTDARLVTLRINFRGVGLSPGQHPGERDEFGSVEDLRALAARLPSEAQVQIKIIPGAGHFFDDQLEELRRAIAEWAEEMLGAEARP